jgi:2-phospho-L-lactate guanylyltransferase (CobY/MobA/RfbA family)
MSELQRRDFALLWLEQVTRQLNDAAAFKKVVSPEQLEHAAGKISEARRILAGEHEGGE